MVREPQPVPEQAAPTLAEDISPRSTPGVPTEADYRREHGTFRAVTGLVWGGSLAVPEGGSVPASHPGLRDTPGRGPGWVSQGDVQVTGDYEIPGDLKTAHEAYLAAQKDTSGA